MYLRNLYRQKEQLKFFPPHFKLFSIVVHISAARRCECV